MFWKTRPHYTDCHFYGVLTILFPEQWYFESFVFLLLSIKSIQLGLIGFLKQVGPTTRLHKLDVLQNDFLAASSISQLKFVF